MSKEVEMDGAQAPTPDSLAVAENGEARSDAELISRQKARFHEHMADSLEQNAVRGFWEKGYGGWQEICCCCAKDAESDWTTGFCDAQFYYCSDDSDCRACAENFAVQSYIQKCECEDCESSGCAVDPLALIKSDDEGDWEFACSSCRHSKENSITVGYENLRPVGKSNEVA